jgi:hypothetical protein
MTTTIYNIGRYSFARGRVDWQIDVMQCVIPHPGYVASLSGHSYVTTLQPYGNLTSVSNRITTPDGWCNSDMIQFTEVPLNTDIDQVVIYRVSDGMLLINIAFPTIRTSKQKALYIKKGVSRPGLFRL